MDKKARHGDDGNQRCPFRHTVGNQTNKQRRLDTREEGYCHAPDHNSPQQSGERWEILLNDFGELVHGGEIVTALGNSLAR